MTRSVLAALVLVSLGARASSDRVRDPAVPASLPRSLAWRFVGPWRGGWATVAAGIPAQPDVFYFGSAGGGIWKTTDAGRTWRGLLQNEGSSAVGALAIAPSDPSVIYAGTGQEAARFDIAAGDGVYRSDDGGENWTHVGLERTRHIGAILVDPSNAKRVLMAALGHVFGPNPERGVFLSTDGGATWEHTLDLGDSVGAVDLAWDPLAPAVVYAAAWQMRMHPWLDYFQPQAGPGSGIYKSTDGGAHWTRLGGGGLPAGLIGRIGLGVARGSSGRIVYATIAISGSPLPTLKTPPGESGIYRSGDGGVTWTLMNTDGSLSSSYFGHLTVAPDDSNTIYVMGRSIQKSTDGGKHFAVFTGSPGGDDYHFLWINASAPSHMIAGSDQGAGVTVNGGASWSSWYNQPTGQFYHLGADDRFPYRVYSGQQDNGTVELLSRGPYGVIDERDWHPVGGDERDYMLPKPGDPDLVIGSGLGGRTSRFDEITRQSADISPWPASAYGVRPTTVKFHYTWITPLAYSPVSPHALYMGSQDLVRSLDDGNHWEAVSPDLSAKRPDAAHCDDENPGLVTARDCGFGVIFAINPSTKAKDLIWIGTDDGLVHVTHDGGRTWSNATPPVPAWGCVTDVDPSALDTNVAYAAIDLHRLDRFEPLAFKTKDGGKTWTSIVGNLPPDEFVTVVRADPERPGLLYAGTNRGVYVSFDDGAQWQPVGSGFPTTWVRDLMVHQGDLIAATQGRGIWILDDIAPLREMPLDAPVHLFRPARATRMRENENRDTPWPPSTPVALNPPTGAVVDYWIGSGAGPVTLTFADSAGHVVRQFSSADEPEHLPADQYFDPRWVGTPFVLSAAPGMHRFVWDLRYPRPKALSYEYSIAAVWGVGTPLEPRGPFVVPGPYRVTLTVGGVAYTAPLTVELDPRVHVTRAALADQLAFARSVDSTLERAVALHEALGKSLADSSTLRAGLADSLRSLEGGHGGIRDIVDALTGLATAVESADLAPTGGARILFADYRSRLDAALAAWQRLAPGSP